MKKIWEWIKTHPYMSLGLGAAVLLLVYLWTSYSSAQQQAAQAATQAGTSGPDDTIQSLEIQASTQLQAAQIAAQAQTAQLGYQAQVDTATVQAQQYASNAQTQAALSLGLAQAGDSTSSILQILAAQPSNQNPMQTTVVPTTTAVSTATGTVNQSPAPTNPAPVTSLYNPLTPAQLAMINGSDLPGNVTTATPQVMTIAHDPHSPTASSGASDTNQSLYEGDVTGTIIGGGTYPVASSYYATPAAAASLDQILGTQSVLSPSVVGASGGPFYNPPTEDVMTPSGTVDAGQMLTELQSTAPGEWNTILSGYGIQDTATINSQLSTLFGPNQAIPASANGVSASTAGS